MREVIGRNGYVMQMGQLQQYEEQFLSWQANSLQLKYTKINVVKLKMKLIY